MKFNETYSDWYKCLKCLNPSTCFYLLFHHHLTFLEYLRPGVYTISIEAVVPSAKQLNTSNVE